MNAIVLGIALLLILTIPEISLETEEQHNSAVSAELS